VLEESERERNEKYFSGKLHGTIRFDDVSFRYSEQIGNVLNNIDLEIKPGEKVAIVGKSGAGKSTFIKLLLNVVDSSEGRVLVDGRDVREIKSAKLHKNIGVVMQDSILFNLSISDNLRLARYNARLEHIEEACRYARLDEFIESLPDKYDTLIGEKGVKLSGGQKQRMAIARVFLSNPGIIIFDEATSSLDYESEKFIHQAIRKLGENKTIILIAHRLSSVMLADRVIVLKDGRVAGVGHHSELLNQNEAYDELFKEQYMEA
jgi:ABC-type multidrug transport system fused ATPase/permease subunit